MPPLPGGGGPVAGLAILGVELITQGHLIFIDYRPTGAGRRQGKRQNYTYPGPQVARLEMIWQALVIDHIDPW